MWFWRSGTDLGVDLGTATVLIYERGKGIVLREPSVVAVDNNTNKILAVGEEAKNMIGRTPGNIIAVRPMKEGVISDYDITEKMLQEFVKKVCGRRRIRTPKVIVCVPSQATEVEKRSVIDAVEKFGAKKVHIIEEPLAAAIGAGLDIKEPNGIMVVDIGGGTTDIAVISLGGVVLRSSIKIAGDVFDECIVKYVRKKHKILIGEKTAEQLKIDIGSAYRNYRNLSSDIRGRNLITGLPDGVSVQSEEVRLAINDSLNMIVENIKSVLSDTPPELAADITSNGILLTGGGSLLDGLDKLIENETGVPVNIAENSIEAVAEGTGVVLKQLEKLCLSVDGQEITLID